MLPFETTDDLRIALPSFRVVTASLNLSLWCDTELTDVSRSCQQSFEIRYPES